jgi:hypothetical protein
MDPIPTWITFCTAPTLRCIAASVTGLALPPSQRIRSG